VRPDAVEHAEVLRVINAWQHATDDERFQMVAELTPAERKALIPIHDAIHNQRIAKINAELARLQAKVNWLRREGLERATKAEVEQHERRIEAEPDFDPDSPPWGVGAS
jgi:hypothetical protein